MMAGAWEPSKGVDTLFTAGAGFLLLATAYDDNYPRGTVHERTSDGRTLTTCPTPEGSMGYDSDVATLVDFCRHRIGRGSDSGEDIFPQYRPLTTGLEQETLRCHAVAGSER